LGTLLDSKDSVHFSIDGYDNASNNLYRVNSDYDSIIDGLQTLRRISDCQIVWAAIAFKFNEHHIDTMKKVARQLGVDRFQLTKSTKFGSVYPSYGVDDPLEPSVKFVSSTHRFEREVTALTEAGKWTAIPLTNLKLFNQTQSRNGVTPLCEIGNKGLYIDALGRLFPCCWVANRYNHNSDWQKKQLDLLDFCYNQPHIVDAIVNNLYYEIDLTFDQEIIIQHCLIYQHGLNLKTWQLEKFPNNTQDLHKLLEPNIHSVENIYNI